MNSPLSKQVVIAIPVLLLGGTELHTLALVEALRSEGYDITVCCYYEFDEFIVSRFRGAGVVVDLLKLRKSDGLFFLLRNLIQFFKSKRPDIVHVQYLAPGLIPILAASMAGVKTIFSTVHIAGRIAYGIKAKFLLRLASRLCRAFFCVSRGVENFWFGNSQLYNSENLDMGRKHYTIYNGVDTERIGTIIKETDKVGLRASLGLGGNKVLGIVGRLAHQKGHTVLLDALVAMIQQFPDLILLIIGKGPQREDLAQKAERLGINKHIIWMGEQSQEEVFRLYSIMDILVMPSRYEGFGLTAAEAMAAGLPVVAAKVDGLTEVIKDGETGHLVEAGNSASLTEAIVSIFSSPELSKQMGQNGTRRVSAFFSLHMFKNSWLSAYSKLSIH